jgi:hypothetical protein
MNRLKKVVLLPVNRLSYRMKLIRLYYWSERRLYLLRAVYVLPIFYYRWLYQFCLSMVAMRKCRRMANRLIHTIPYHVRFELA